MKNIINYFLTAAPWALCLMMVAPYGVYKFLGFGHTPMEWGLLVIYFLSVTIGWIYSVGVSANQLLNDQLKIRPALFTAAALYPFVAVLWFIVAVLMPLVRGDIVRPPEWAVFVHFGAVFCVAYCFWYAARQFTAYRLQRAVIFVDYYPAFMGFWFAFIGVWFLQPKVIDTFKKSDQAGR